MDVMAGCQNDTLRFLLWKQGYML